MRPYIKVTFSSRDDKEIGSIQLDREMAFLIDMQSVVSVCNNFRDQFHSLGEPLDYEIKFKSEDV